MGAAFDGQAMAGSMHVAVVMLVGLDHRVDDLLGALRRGGIVEINERAILAEHRLQDRKIAADRPDVERRGGLRLTRYERRRQERSWLGTDMAVAACYVIRTAGLERYERQRLLHGFRGLTFGSHLGHGLNASNHGC